MSGEMTTALEAQAAAWLNVETSFVVASNDKGWVTMITEWESPGYIEHENIMDGPELVAFAVSLGFKPDTIEGTV